MNMPGMTKSVSLEMIYTCDGFVQNVTGRWTTNIAVRSNRPVRESKDGFVRSTFRDCRCQLDRQTPVPGNANSPLSILAYISLTWRTWDIPVYFVTTSFAIAT